MKKKVSINMVFNVSYNLLNIVFPLITSVYLARILGPENIGRVTYAQNIMQYFLVVASLGIPTYGMRQISRCGNDAALLDKTFSELFFMNLTTSLLCSCLYTSIILVNKTFCSEIPLYLCVGITLYFNILNIDWFYTGREEYVYITIRSFFVKIISIIAIFLFVRTKSDYVIYALITSLAITGNYIFNILHLKGNVHFVFEKLNIKKHIKPAIVLLAVLFSSNLYNQIDVTMIGAMVDKEAVGFYSNPVKIIRIVTSLTTTISATILPQLCTQYKIKNVQGYNRLFNKTFKLVFLISMCTGVGILSVSNNLVYTLWGEEFLSSISVISILSIIIPIITVSYTIGSVVLTSTDNEDKLLIATLSGALTNIIGNFLLISILGINGAAIASVISEVVVLLVHFYYGKEYINFDIDKKYIFSTLFPVLAMFFCVIIINYILKVNSYVELIIQILVGGSLCLGIMFFMKNDVLKDLLIRLEYILKHV